MAENINILGQSGVIDQPVGRFETLALSIPTAAFTHHGPSVPNLTGYNDLLNINPFTPLLLQSTEKRSSNPNLLWSACITKENVTFCRARKRVGLEADKVNDVLLLSGKTLGARQAAAREINANGAAFVSLFLSYVAHCLLSLLARMYGHCKRSSRHHGTLSTGTITTWN